MRKLLFILMVCVMACFSGCASSRERAIKHRNEAVSIATYAIKRSLDAGRFDLAQKYSESLTKIVAPPTKEVKIAPIHIKNQKTGVKEKSVVLPPTFHSSAPIVIRDSAEFNAVVEAQPEVKKQLAEEQKEIQKVEKQIAKVERETEKLALEPIKKSSGWGWVWGIVTGGGILGIIALCVFVPAAIPFIQAAFSWFATVFTAVVKWLTSLWVKKS